MDQAQASRKVLAQSQEEKFPYTIKELGLDIEVHEGVFSPKHFSGWRVFTPNIPFSIGDNILEIGCGHGAVSVYLAKHGAIVKSVDINSKAIENTKANAKRNNVTLDVRLSDVYSAIKLQETFDIICWNMPFIPESNEYQYESMLERGLFDPGYRLTDRLLKETPKYLKPKGKLLIGSGDFADLKRFHELAQQYEYNVKLIVSKDAMELQKVNFKLYELKK